LLKENLSVSSMYWERADTTTTTLFSELRISSYVFYNTES